MDFEDAAREWTELLRDGAHALFAKQHADTILQLAVTLARAQDLESAIDHDAIRAHCATQEDEHVLLGCALVIKRLLNVIVRDRMRFLLPEHQLPQSDESSASQRESLAQQQALLLKIPRDFREAFVATLRANWDALDTAAHSTKLSLLRLADLQWSIAPPGVVLRIQTSDGATRTVQVPMQQFHQLRYSTAKVLQEMHHVETHPIMRLTRTAQHIGSSAGSVPAAP